MNEKIQAARSVALDVLKPSAKDLEHGLELHANSLVIESYGFAPRSAINGDRIRAAIEAGASDVEIQDLLEDIPMTRHAEDPEACAEFIDAWHESGVTCVLQNAGQEGQSITRLMKRLARFIYVTDMLPDFVNKAASPDDIVKAKRLGRHCFYLMCNGVPLPEDWNSVEEELRYIRVFFELGCRMMHLTYNRRNMVADGCGEPGNAGLSDFGRCVVAEMNRVGVMVDVAHSSVQTGFDAARCSKAPVVASHSCCAALNAHCRAKPDELIRAIADTGGYIGICCIPIFLGGSGDISAFLDHIDHAVKTFGADHVAIGTDVAYTSRATDDEWKKVPPRPKRRKAWESLWPQGAIGDDPRWNAPRQRQSMAWTNWPLFTVGMVQRGHSDQDIQKILGLNVLRVAQAVFDARS